MVRKHYFIVTFLFILGSLSAHIYNKDLDEWIINNEKVKTPEVIENKEDREYTVQQTSFFISANHQYSPLYISDNKHSGYSEVFFNDRYIGSFGSIQTIWNKIRPVKSWLPLPQDLIEYNDLNTLRIHNYGYKTTLVTSVTISDNESLTISNKLSSVTFNDLSISFALILILMLLTYFIYFKRHELDDFKVPGLIPVTSLLILYFITSYFSLPALHWFYTSLIPKSFLFLSWILFLRGFILRYKIATPETVTYSIFWFFGLFLSYLIINPFNQKLYFEITRIFIFLTLVINLIFILSVLYVHIKHKKRMDFILVGTSLSFLLALTDFILMLSHYTTQTFFQETGIFCLILSLFYSYMGRLLKINNSTKKYYKKISDTLSRMTEEVEEKSREIHELQEIKEENNREKNIFLTSLSNNLRTPLNSIIGYSENIISHKSLEECYVTADNILKESDRLYQIINSILDFSSVELISKVPASTFTISGLLKSSLEKSTWSESQKKLLTMVCDEESVHTTFSGNAKAMEGIISHIIWYYINQHKTPVTINISKAQKSEKFFTLIFKISIDKQNSHMPIPLIKLKIVEKYVYILGGEVIHSDTGQNGFTLSLPFAIAKEIPGKVAEKLPVNQMVLEKTLRVLVVEDYLPNMNIVKNHLEKMGCTVFSAVDGCKAVELFKECKPDLILMDINMPNMNGWEATEEIRKHPLGLNVQILGLTASVHEMDIRHCFESGMNDVMEKPIRKKQLFNKLSALKNETVSRFPEIETMCKDMGLSEAESEALLRSTISQIEKQVETIKVLNSARDRDGINRELPALMAACQNINAFYLANLIRSLTGAFESEDQERILAQITLIDNLITEVMTKYEYLLRN